MSAKSEGIFAKGGRYHENDKGIDNERKRVQKEMGIGMGVGVVW